MFEILEKALRENEKEVAFVCIGTDRVLGDTLGPLVGTLLEEAKIPNVFGTLEKPIETSTYKDFLEEIKDKDYLIVAVDSAMGENLGKISVSEGGLLPRFETLPEIGNISIRCTVAPKIEGYGEDKLIEILKYTSLYTVYTLAKEIANNIIEIVYKIEKETVATTREQ